MNCQYLISFQAVCKATRITRENGKLHHRKTTIYKGNLSRQNVIFGIFPGKLISKDQSEHFNAYLYYGPV